MTRRVVVNDDHTGNPIPDRGPDETTLVQVGDVVWEAYMAPDTQEKLEQTIREFFMVGDPPTRRALMTVTRTRAQAEPKKSIYPHSHIPIARTKKPTSAERQEQRERIRAWANGHSSPYLARQVIGDRGRIPSTVTAAFYEAFPDEDRLFVS